jgi:hypothetical protein
MTTRSFADVPSSSASLLAQLLDTGMSREFAESTVRAAVAAGEVQDAGGGSRATALSTDAEHEAVSIATALAESRVRTSDLASAAQAGTKRRRLYTVDYPAALEAAGIEAIELVERFPIMTGVYGYTRGKPNPGQSRLVPFKPRSGRTYTVYGDVAETEALFIRLAPMAVADWLRLRGFALPAWTDSRTARLAIASSVQIAAPGEDPPAAPSPGSTLLTLVHSVAHRLIRRASVLAGIDRNALSEYLVPWHLGFFVFAAARGSFVLGGLQALFETELHTLLRSLVHAEHRCALDPGCSRAGASCAACLHLGEPSCRWFNRFLDRGVLHGDSGYFRTAGRVGGLPQAAGPS